MVEQGSEEWFAARLGKITSSRVKDVMAKGRSGAVSATRKNYMTELLCQRLTGEREESYTSGAMQRGTDMEPLARAAYEVMGGVMVVEAEFILHPEHPFTGSSPDGYVGDDGLVEIKCPNTATHIACIQSGKHDSKYEWQMQHQMFCADRQWCDFASFDDRLPEPLQLFISRVHRDNIKIMDMIEAIQIFEDELHALHVEMLTIMEKGNE
ncbi:MAG: lambda exonuclease family protein [Pseudomonadales bacterium]